MMLNYYMTLFFLRQKYASVLSSQQRRAQKFSFIEQSKSVFGQTVTLVKWQILTGHSFWTFQKCQIEYLINTASAGVMGKDLKKKKEIFPVRQYDYTGHSVKL